MKKAERIKKKYEFDHFINHTKAIKNPYFLIHYNPKKEAITRFGIAVGTKIGNAVIRNKFKRRIREIIHAEINLFPKELDYIIMVRKAALALDYTQMKESLIDLIKQVKK